MKRQFSFLVIILLSISLLSACSRTHSENINDYFCWNNKTNTILRSHFNNTLPEKSLVDHYGTNYYYNLSQGILGNPNLVIYVSVQFPDDSGYQSEIDKLNLSADSIQDENVSIYFIQGTQQDIDEYTDENIYDGMFYNFEIIITNDESNEISFINAYVWDYYKDDLLVSLLKTITIDTLTF